MEENDLERRVEELERQVAELREQMGAPGRAERPEPVYEVPAREAKEPRKPAFNITTAQVVDKIGIALLLLGVGFLLKYSYDQGWLTETIRVVLGAITGVILLVTGIRQRESNAPLSAVLCGGAIATFYGTLFAAYELYDLIPATFALVSTLGVTMLGFVLAVRQEQPALASIAAIGGLATPFLLDSSGNEPFVLSAFTSIVLLGTTAIFIFKRWQSLLITAGIGGFGVLLIAAEAVEGDPFVKYLPVLIGLGIATFATSFAPVLRAKLNDTDLKTTELLTGVAGPLVALPIAYYAADENAFATALLAIVLAGLSLLASQVEAAKTTFEALAAVLAVMFLGVVFDVEPAAISFLGGAAALGWAARDRKMLFLPAYPLLGIGGLWTTVLLFEWNGTPFLNAEAFQMLFGIAVLALFAVIHDKTIRWFHIVLAVAATFAMFASQLADVSGGAGITTGIWGALALAMLVGGFARDEGKLQALGVVAVLVTSGKLLFIDLESVATIVRVGLFMGMGAALLVVSAVVGSMRGDEGSSDRGEEVAS